MTGAKFPTRDARQNRSFSRILHHELELVASGGQTTLSFQLGREVPVFLLLCLLTSASCERVFLLLKCMLGGVRMNSLSDQLQCAH